MLGAHDPSETRLIPPQIPSFPRQQSWYFNNLFLGWSSLNPSCFIALHPAETRCGGDCHLLAINQHPNKQGLWCFQRKKKKQRTRERRREKFPFDEHVPLWESPAASDIWFQLAPWRVSCLPGPRFTSQTPHWRLKRKTHTQSYSSIICLCVVMSPEPPVKILLVYSQDPRFFIFKY